MGKIIQNIKAKTILVIAMLATILMQIIAPILPVNAETLKDDYIEFSAVWANGTNQNNIDSGKAGTINFGLKLSGISTGFQNLKIYASEESSGITPSAEINFNKTDYADNSNGRILIFESTMNSGLDISGNLSVVFNKNIDLTEYDKTIKLTLTGEYKDPVTKSVQTINKTIKLNAHIKPVEVNGFYVQTNYNDKVTSEKKDLDNFWKTEWVTTKFGTDIVLTVNANNFTYLEYNLETEKHSSVAMKNNLEIDTTELENAGFNVTKTGNIITLKYGKKDNIYNENEIYSINKKFNIPVRYTVPEDTINNAKWDGGVLEFTYRIIGTAQGYSITKSKLGTTTNEVETYEYTGIRNTVRVDLGNFEYLYGLYTHNNILDKTREELQEDINSGNIILNSEIRIDAKDYRLESDRSNIFFKIANGTTQNMGVQVKYYDENGNIQTQRIEDSIYITEFKNCKYKYSLKNSINGNEFTLEDIANNKIYANNFGIEFESEQGERQIDFDLNYKIPVDVLKEKIGEENINRIIEFTTCVTTDFIKEYERDFEPAEQYMELIKQIYEGEGDYLELIRYNSIYVQDTKQIVTLTDEELKNINSTYVANIFKKAYELDYLETIHKTNEELAQEDSSTINKEINGKIVKIYSLINGNLNYGYVNLNETFEIEENNFQTFSVADIYSDFISEKVYHQIYSNTEEEQYSKYMYNDVLVGLDFILKNYTQNYGVSDRPATYDFCSITGEVNEQLSYLEVQADDYDISATQVNRWQPTEIINLKMYKNNNVIKTQGKTVKNVNPKIYVELPSDFEYRITDVTLIGGNGKIYIPNSYEQTEKMDNKTYSTGYYDQVTSQDGKKFLVINCVGEYNSLTDGEITISIKHRRKLLNAYANGVQYIKAYMITDNENYTTKVNNEFSFNKGTEVVGEVFYGKDTFNIEKSNNVAVSTGIYVEGTKRVPIIENINGSLGQEVSKINPAICKESEVIKYFSEIANNTNIEITNINMVTRLPIAGNKTITGNTYRLVEEGYKLPEEFWNVHNVVGGLNSTSTISEITLKNIDNIKVYIIGNIRGGKKELDPTLYTISYSTDPNAGINSTYTPYIQGESDLTNATTLQLKLNEDYKLAANSIITLEYEMTMPNESGMVGETTAVSYKKLGETTENILEPSAAYVMMGNEAGTIELIKQFEGFEPGVAPEGINIQGIQFQFKDEQGNALVTKETNSEGIASTDANGKITLTGVPDGIYTVTELTEFENYDKIVNKTIIVENSEIVKFTAVQPTKQGNLTINKKWEDTNDVQGPVTFRITRTNNDNYVYTADISINEETGIAKAIGIPYGTYKVQEITGVYGWYAEDVEVTINNNNPNVEIDIENKIGKGTLEIIKKVPSSAKEDTVEGLTFEIKGNGFVNYVNKENVQVSTDTVTNVTIGQDYSNNENINVEISQDKKTATITLTNMPLGIYTVTEIEMPTVGEGENETDRYAVVSATKSLEKNEEKVTFNLTNQWKYGTLKIEKIAGLYVEGQEDIEIGDLSNFSVRVTGTSLYGTVVDKIVPLNEDGHAAISLEIGQYKVEEISVDGYITNYIKIENNEEIKTTTPPEVTILYNTTTTQKIYNQHTGVGYVKVVKTLEGVEDAQKVINAGIQFKITGKDVAGRDIEEIISINTIEEINGKEYAVGISGKIPTGGEYELEEIESTIPDYYEGIEPIQVQLTTANTQENPLVFNLENVRSKGNLEIETQTVPEGGELTGIIYEVVEVELTDDGKYVEIESTKQQIAGSNEIENASFAKLENIPAGNYLVKQIEVPIGYEKDLAQIVEVPSYSTGYALFEISKTEELQNTSLKIEKQVLNNNGQTATQKDFEKAKLNSNESFEVKITNLETQKIYYTFVENGKTSEIRNLPEGTYLIEEIYKPKYLTQGYYLITEENTLKIENEIPANNGKYIITIGNEIEGTNNVNVKIKNTINTDFGFGGQNLADNYSKYNEQIIEEMAITKTVIYVVDENNKEIPNSKFQLYDELGNIVKLGNAGQTITTTNRRIIIKGLQPGKYTMKCIEVPQGYLLPKDKEIVVYNEAVRVTRIEVKTNIPRGNVTLSTVYKVNEGTENEKEKFVSRSKYKIVDTSTGELVKFIKTLDGNYEKTNLLTGLEEISLKSGYVKLEGMEVGNYEIGLVDVTDGYAVTSDVPASVTITNGAEIDVKTIVRKNQIVQVVSGYDSTLYLDTNGDVWYAGFSGYGIEGNTHAISFGGGNQYVFNKINFPKDVKIKQIATDYQSYAAIDTTGKLWTWGYKGILSDNVLGNIEVTDEYKVYPITCLNTQKGNKFNSVLEQEPDFEIIEIQSLNNGYIALDNKGRIFTWGTWVNEITCVTENNEKLQEEYLKGNIITKLCNTKEVDNFWGAIDNKGRIWLGYNNNIRYVSDEFTDDLYGVNIIKGEISYDTVLLDNEGYVWIAENYSSDFVRLDYSKFNNNRIIDVATYAKAYAAIDEQGNVWTWGRNTYNGYLGTGSTDSNLTTQDPICLQADKNNSLYGVKATKIVMDYDSVYVIDNNNLLWAWGQNNFGINGDSTYYEPILLTTLYNEKFEYNLKFEDIQILDYQNSMLALDYYGNVWGWGYLSGTGTNVKIPEQISIETKIEKIESSGNIAIALDENGEIYMWGYSYGEMPNTSNGNIYIPQKIEASAFENAKIVDISAGYSSVIALDENGTIWAWGQNTYGEAGTGNTTSIVSPTKVSFKNTDGTAFNKKFINIYLGEGGVAVAIDEDGKVWTWGYKYYLPLSEQYKNNNLPSTYIEPICLSNIEGNSLQQAYENDIRFTKITNKYNSSGLIDNKGKLWIRNTNTGNFVCVSQIENHILNNSDENYKFTQVIAVDSGTLGLCAIDSNGDLWNVTESTATKLNAQNTSLEGLKISKYRNSGNNIAIINSEGKICTGGNNTYGQLGDGTTVNKELVGLFSGAINKLYNHKVANIISDRFIETETGKIFNIKAENIKYEMESAKYIENNNLGKVKQVEYISVATTSSYDNDKLFAIAVDEEGKVWTWGSNSNTSLFGSNSSTFTTKTIPECISNIETNPLYLAKQANNNFKIETIEIIDNSYILAKDNEGGVWIWGVSTINYLGGTNSKEPFKVNGTGTVLEGKTIDKLYYKANTFVILSEGKVYTASYYAGGLSGSDTANTQLTQVMYEGNEIKDISNIEVSNNMVIAYNENLIYTWGYNGYGALGTGNNVLQNTPVKLEANINIKEILCCENSLGYALGCVAIDKQGKVWTWGNGGIYNILGYTGASTYNKPICISDIATNVLNGVKVTEFISNPLEATITVKDETGTLYGWGYKIQALPVKLTDHYNTQINELFGSATNANVLNFIKGMNDGYVIVNGELYTITLNTNGTITYLKQQGALQGVTVVQASPNKALDNNGNLYVWGNNTGIANNITKPINITNIEKLTDAVFTSGWTLLKKQR